MRLGNTLTNDFFKGYEFDYCISNPPFGIDWKADYPEVEKEYKKGANGRFGVGLPKKSDGQLLFMLNGISKLKDTGRMGIIHNGSALFSGAAGSGESEIRRYVIENDWLDAIIQLPNDVFYNTGISTYVWIIDKSKQPHRQGQRRQARLALCFCSCPCFWIGCGERPRASPRFCLAAAAWGSARNAPQTPR